MELQRVSRLASAGGDYSALVDESLQLMLDVGFERARFYQVATNPFAAAGAERELYLFAQVAGTQGSDGSLTTHFPIPWHQTTLASQGRPHAPAVDCYENADQPWVVDLNMAERAWVDVPVICGNDVVAVLAADLRGTESDVTDRLSSDDAAVLGHLLGAALRGPVTPSIAVGQDLGEGGAVRNTPPQELLRKIVGAFSEANNIASAVVFEYDWTRRSLSSKFRYLNPALNKKQVTELAEEYAVGEFLTGQAFDSQRFNRVPNFDTIIRDMPDLVAPDSRDWHERALGKIQTVAFATVGRYEKRFLIRLMNSATRPTLPFFSEDKRFRELVGELSPVVDGAISRMRVAALEDLSSLISTDPQMDDVFRRVAKVLAPESVSEFGVVAHRSGVDGFVRNAHVQGDRVSHLPIAAKEPRDDQRYQAAIAPGQPELTLQDFREDRRTVLSLGGVVTNAVCAKFRSGNTVGILVIPVRPLDGRGVTGLPDLRLGIHLPELIRHTATLVGQAIEATYRSMQARGAMRALGLVGHEMATPVARLASTAESAINCGLDGLDRAGSEDGDGATRSSLNLFRDKIGERREEVRAAITLGRLVARDSEGKLLVEARHFNLGSTVLKAIREFRRELELTPDLPSMVPEVREQVRALPAAVHDTHLVRAALLNLLRNAAKYSDPRYRQTEVGASSSRGWFTIWIRNHGREIPEEMHETIFEPFVRGVDSDSTLARRGMGLGLFLARRIARAHGGDVRIQEHVPVGPRRGERDVWRTTFEFRLASDIASKQYEFDFGTLLGIPRKRS